MFIRYRIPYLPREVTGLEFCGFFFFVLVFYGHEDYASKSIRLCSTEINSHVFTKTEK
jgi:hypothetical protein